MLPCLHIALVCFVLYHSGVHFLLEGTSIAVRSERVGRQQTQTGLNYLQEYVRRKKQSSCSAQTVVTAQIYRTRRASIQGTIVPPLAMTWASWQRLMAWSTSLEGKIPPVSNRDRSHYRKEGAIQRSTPFPLKPPYYDLDVLANDWMPYHLLVLIFEND